MRRLTCLFAVFALACGQGTQKKDAPEPISTALAPYVLDGVPSDIKHRIFIDFEAKVHLIGYDIEPAGEIGPGSKAKLKLYWKSVAKLSPGWRLYTHLLDPYGRRFKNLTDVEKDQLSSGVLRSPAFTPAK